MSPRSEPLGDLPPEVLVQIAGFLRAPADMSAFVGSAWGHMQIGRYVRIRNAIRDLQAAQRAIRTAISDTKRTWVELEARYARSFAPEAFEAFDNARHDHHLETRRLLGPVCIQLRQLAGFANEVEAGPDPEEHEDDLARLRQNIRDTEILARDLNQALG